MKKIFVSFFASSLFLASVAQSNNQDTSMRATAVAVCDCLNKAGITDKTTTDELQKLFLNCIFTSAPDIITKIAAGGQDYTTAGQQIAMELGMEMMKINCPAFTKIAGSMAMTGANDDFEMLMPSGIQTEKVESTDGMVTKVEERDFIYITVKSTTGRELIFIYYNYVPGSDDWVKDATVKLKNKNVSLSYVESEVYQPKYKQFMNVKEIKTLTIK